MRSHYLEVSFSTEEIQYPHRRVLMLVGMATWSDVTELLRSRPWAELPSLCCRPRPVARNLNKVAGNGPRPFFTVEMSLLMLALSCQALAGLRAVCLVRTMTGLETSVVGCWFV
eukprot:COSAG06_NODE_753_length_12547_cov_928.116244_14_plen_114_part_00